MKYTEQVFDRRTGELVEVSAGDWITITELGEMKGVTARRIRIILREMGFLYVEGGRTHNRHRLTPEVVKQGFGKHIPAKPPKVRYPFDVISPAGREWIEARWSEAVAALESKLASTVIAQASEALNAFRAERLNDLNVQGCVIWLCDHFPDLTHTEMASVLDVTQQVVSRYVSIRSRQKASAMLRVSQPLPYLGKVRISMLEDEVLASGGARFITQAHNSSESELCYTDGERLAA
ncbi:hypothetical protein [Methylobacterium sp. P1-11]|uniref:hypothetical protein n=1 Tax=Methylobacterium sp. P1-11 TaxID=2024616 RepID=UPI0018D8E0F8|nr:hypothetical protein [Methylobacterium sp. P1-11]